MKEGITKLFSFSSTYIEAIGYDAQCALLEVRMANNGRLRRYVNVPEEVWYQFRESANPDMYYRRCICGHFRETTVRPLMHSKTQISLDKNKISIYANNENRSHN